MASWGEDDAGFVPYRAGGAVAVGDLPKQELGCALLGYDNRRRTWRVGVFDPKWSGSGHDATSCSVVVGWHRSETAFNATSFACLLCSYVVLEGVSPHREHQ